MIDVRVFNLLVHYGEQDEKNLVDLLEDGLLDYLNDGPVWGNSNPAYVKDVKTKKTTEGRILLTGYFHRASELEWDFVPKDDFTAKSEHGVQQVMPQARFSIDLLEHKLLWITARGKTHKPHPKNFESYLKYGFLPILRGRYSEIANVLYAEKYGETPRSERPKVGQFRAEYLQKMRLSRSEFKLKLVPLIADKELETYFKEKRYKIRKVKFYPHISNPTNDELADLFVDVAKFGSEAGGKVNLEIAAADKSKGVNKAAIQEVFEKNREKQLVDVRMIVEDKESPEEKPITVTNRMDNKGEKESTDISIRFEFNTSIDDGSVVGSVLRKLEEQGLMDLQSIGNKIVERFNRLIGK